MKTQGTIKVIMDVQTFDSGFTKVEFVIITKDKYPQELKFEIVQDSVPMLQNFAEGEEVDVSFDLRGNEYNDKYYVNLRAWKIEKVAGAAPVKTTPEVNHLNDEDDPLPF